MKITVITCPFGALPPNGVGAVEKLFHLLAVEWVKMGHEVCFVCAGGGDNPKIEYRRLKKYNRTGSTKTDLIWDFFYSVKAIWHCPKTDVLLCNTFWTPFLAPLMRWKYKKLVYGVHRFPKRQFFLYPFVHKFICVSTVVANALKRQVAAERVCVVVNPIDTSVFKPEPRRIVEGRVLYAGRVHPLKGLRCLAEACRSLAEEGLVKELVLVGPWETGKGGGGQSFVDELKALAGACPVVLRGAVSNPCELASIERSAEVFVYPSEDALGEACPVAPMEAMALGVPTVVSGLACYDDYVLDGEDAFKFPTSNSKELTRIIRRLLTDESLRMRIGKSASLDVSKLSAVNVAAWYMDEFDHA